MRPSFLPSLVSLGDQGDPAEQLLGILGEHRSETGEAGDNLFTDFSVLTPSHMHTDTQTHIHTHTYTHTQTSKQTNKHTHKHI